MRNDGELSGAVACSGAAGVIGRDHIGEPGDLVEKGLVDIYGLKAKIFDATRACGVGKVG